MSENETAKIRVAVVDDHEMFRAGVIATLRDSFSISSAKRRTCPVRWR